MVDEDDTEVGVILQADTDPLVIAADTDRDIATPRHASPNPIMFEDTGMVIVDRPLAPTCSDRLVITFRRPTPPPWPEIDFAEASRVEFADDEPPTETFEPTPRSTRASTSAEWPPPPREPAAEAPPIREHTSRRAAVYAVVTRPDTDN